jgi:hypothetical protein
MCVACSVEETGRSLTRFMDLFEKDLVHLLSPPLEDDENSKPPLISTFPVSPVLGMDMYVCIPVCDYLN